MHHFGMRLVSAVCWFYQTCVFLVWFETIMQNICALFFGPDSIYFLPRLKNCVWYHWATFFIIMCLFNLKQHFSFQKIVQWDRCEHYTYFGTKLAYLPNGMEWKNGYTFSCCTKVLCCLLYIEKNILWDEKEEKGKNRHT